MLTVTATRSSVVKYHGLGRCHRWAPSFLMQPLFNGGTLGGRSSNEALLGTDNVKADLDRSEHQKAVVAMTAAYAMDRVGNGGPLPPDVL